MLYLNEFDDPRPDRAHEEQASRRIIIALLVAGSAVAALYCLGMLLAAFAGGG